LDINAAIKTLKNLRYLWRYWVARASFCNAKLGIVMI
jgi:hypothetical protein